jgi:hypothetical protein
MLRSLFRGSPPKYEKPPVYTEGILITEGLPSYEQLFRTGKDKPCKGSADTFTRPGDVAKAIEKVTSGKEGYIRLDKTTVSPKAIIEYFIKNGEGSCRDVYLLSVLTSNDTSKNVYLNGTKQVFGENAKTKKDKVIEENVYYLVSRKVNVSISNFRGLSKMPHDFCYRKISVHNSWAVTTNVIAMSTKDQENMIRCL